VSDFAGLFVLVKVSGSKSWHFKYRINGKEKLLVIGDYPAVSLAQARKARGAARALLAHGNDPNEAKQEDKRFRMEAKGQTFEKIGAGFLVKSVRRENRRQHFLRLNITESLPTATSGISRLPKQHRA
jgi:hypothetical protein